jgi:hypothetical protein
MEYKIHRWLRVLFVIDILYTVTARWEYTLMTGLMAMSMAILLIGIFSLINRAI